MSVNDVIEYSLKDNGKVLTARISIPGGTSLLDTYRRMLPRIAGGVINSLPGILSYFPTGSEVFLEMRNLTPSTKGTTRQSKGRKAKKKKSRRTGGRSSNTSKDSKVKAGKKIS